MLVETKKKKINDLSKIEELIKNDHFACASYYE
jgi:hypothetical protein